MDFMQMSDDQLRAFIGACSNEELERTLDAETKDGPSEALVRLTAMVATEVARRPEELSLARVVGSLGRCFSKLACYSEASTSYGQAQGIFTRFDRESEAAQFALRRANALANLGRNGEALAGYDEARADFARLNREIEVARCTMNRGIALSHLGRFEEALAGYVDAGSVFARTESEGDNATCTQNRACALAGLGRFSEALAAHEEARDVFARLGRKGESALCALGSAAVLADLGRRQEALARYDEAEAVFRHLCRESDVAGCTFDRANVLLSLCRLEEALAGYEEARKVFERLGQEIEVARCVLNRAYVLAHIRRHKEALAGYEEAEAVFSRLGRETDAAGCAMNRANVLADLGRGEEALAGYEEAEAVFSRLGRETDAAGCAMNRAAMFARLGRREEAFAGYEEARGVFERFDLQIGIATCNMNRADGLLDLGRHAEAIAALDAAEPIFARFDELDSLVRCLNGLGDCHLALADRPAALASYEAACDALEEALTRVGSRDEDASGLREQLPDPFVPAVTLLLRDAATAADEAREPEAAALRERAFRLAERARSARLREELGRRLVGGLGLEAAGPELVARWRALQGELAVLDLRLRNEGRRGGGALEEAHEAQQGRRGELLAELTAVERELFATDPEAAGLLSARLPELAELRADLAEGEGLVCYLSGGKDERLVAFCLDRGSLAARVLEVTDAEALAALAAGVAACEQDEFTGAGSAEAWQEQLGALGEHLLFLPAALGWLEGDGRKRRLTFVPSGALFGLPFAALGLPGSAAYAPLISACEVALAPQAFTRLYQKGKGEEASGAVALIDPGQALGYGALEKAALERALPGFEGNAHRGPLSAEEALALMTDRALVHLSCHGRFEPGAPWQSRLVFHGEGEQPETYLTALQLFSRPPGRQRLFVAAACQSGVNSVLAGDALLGLDRALLYRARQVLVTLWSVADAATVDLEASFYRAYAAEADPVAALATAQNAFLDGVQGDGGPADAYPAAHPYYWAGFVVMG